MPASIIFWLLLPRLRRFCLRQCLDKAHSQRCQCHSHHFFSRNGTQDFNHRGNQFRFTKLLRHLFIVRQQPQNVDSLIKNLKVFHLSFENRTQAALSDNLNPTEPNPRWLRGLVEIHLSKRIVEEPQFRCKLFFLLSIEAGRESNCSWIWHFLPRHSLQSCDLESIFFKIHLKSCAKIKLALEFVYQSDSFRLRSLVSFRVKGEKQTRWKDGMESPSLFPRVFRTNEWFRVSLNCLWKWDINLPWRRLLMRVRR